MVSGRHRRRPAPGPLQPGAMGAAASRFVVRQHAGPRHRWELWLEIDGQLAGWAVPGGPPGRPGASRRVTPLEGPPPGSLLREGPAATTAEASGPVIVWDLGSCRLVGPGPASARLRRGALELDLWGYKLRGRWSLVRERPRLRRWRLQRIAHDDASTAARGRPAPRSVLSGLTAREAGHPAAALASTRARLARLGAPVRAVAAPVPLMLAGVAEGPFSDPDWLFELKYDGIRVLAQRDGAHVRLFGRDGRLVTGRYPDVAAALSRLPAEQFLLDGELVALDAEGRPSFQHIQARLGLDRPGDVAAAAAATPVLGFFFDCLAFEGLDLRDLALEERRRALERLLPPAGPVRFTDHVVGAGEALHAAAGKLGLEGIVAKRRHSPYRSGRRSEWLKIKCQRRQEFVVGGFTDPRGHRQHLGALHLGLYEGPDLVYVSRVGSGFDRATLAAIRQRLDRLRRPTSPFARGTPAGPGHHWVDPRLVVEVRFTEWTRGGGLRHPTFLGLREDRLPTECRREAPDPGTGGTRPDPVPSPRRPAASSSHHARGPRTGSAGAATGPTRAVHLTNLDKVFWPVEGYTKGDLIAYYEAVSPWLLPYLRDRPVVLTRYPDGITGKAFFQKDAPAYTPAWIRRARLRTSGADRAIDYFVIDDLDTLRYVINLGTIPLHVWSSRLPRLDRPDWLVLDLDPKGAPFVDVVRVARALLELLDELEAPCHLKTSGATGLHLLVPLGARYTHQEARTLARLLATLGVQAIPERATLARPLGARGGKVYIDWGQNGQGQTIAAPFAVRPLPGAPASWPLTREELRESLHPGRFTIRTIPRRLARRVDPLAPVLGTGIDVARILSRIQGRLERHPPRS